MDGNGDRGMEIKELDDFERVEINGDFDVEISIGSESSAIIETDENLLDLIVTHISGNKLIIETRNGVCIRPTHRVQISVTTTSLNEISLYGSGFVFCYGATSENFSIYLAGSGEIECDNIEAAVTDLELDGSGLIECDVETDDLSARIEGSGDIKLRGNCVSADHKITGSGNIKAGQVNSDVCTVNISGSGITEVDVNDALDVTIIGSGKVYYTGNPVIQQHISGSGKVIER